MDKALELFFKRRSVRKYQKKEISDKQINNILEAAMSAPSACAKDPWHFIIVKKPKTLKLISDGLPNGKMLADAPLGIIVCGDIEKAHGNELSYMLQDCSAAIENILLAVTALKLGACWLGVHPREDRITHIKKLLGLPEKIIPVSAIAIGHPGENNDSRTRFNPDSVHMEKW